MTYFIQVVEKDGYSNAARALFVSQPTLSRAVKELETSLGVQLIRNVGKRITVTEHGQYLYEKAKAILDECENIAHSINDVRGLQRGVVRIGIPPIIGTCVFSGLIAEFVREYPRIDLVIDQHGAKQIQRLVELEELDLGFTLMPTISNVLHAIPLIQDRNVVVLPEDHTLASRSSLSYRDLKFEKFILLNEEYMLYSNVLVGCRDAGYEPDTVFKLTQWDFVVQLVEQGLGISILPEPISRLYRPKGIKCVSLDHDSSRWNISVVQKRNSKHSMAVSAFLDFVLSTYADAGCLLQG